MSDFGTNSSLFQISSAIQACLSTLHRRTLRGLCLRSSSCTISWLRWSSRWSSGWECARAGLFQCRTGSRSLATSWHLQNAQSKDKPMDWGETLCAKYLRYSSRNQMGSCLPWWPWTAFSILAYLSSTIVRVLNSCLSRMQSKSIKRTTSPESLQAMELLLLSSFRKGSLRHLWKSTSRLYTRIRTLTYSISWSVKSFSKDYRGSRLRLRKTRSWFTSTWLKK